MRRQLRLLPEDVGPDNRWPAVHPLRKDARDCGGAGRPVQPDWLHGIVGANGMTMWAYRIIKAEILRRKEARA